MDFSRDFADLAEQAILRLKLLEDSGLTELPGSKENLAANKPLPGKKITVASEHKKTLDDILAEIKACEKCADALNKRLPVIHANIKIAFVFDSPLDETHEELISKVIEAMKLKKDEVYISSAVKCALSEGGMQNAIKNCAGFLEEELKLLPCQHVVIMGKAAAKFIKNPENGIFGPFGNKTIMPTFSPLEFADNKAVKKTVWEHMQKVMGKLKG